jgi:hypothetical protein
MVFQRAVPDDHKGRFFGIVDTLQAGTTPLAYMAVGTVSTAGGVASVLLANGLGLLALAGIVLVIPRLRVELGEGLTV